MRKTACIVAVFMLVGMAPLPGLRAAGVSAGEGITKPVLVRSLGYGNSLAVVRIVDKRAADTELGRGFFVIRAQVLRLLIPGDLSMRDLSQGLEFLGGTPYADRLSKGETYAVFLDGNILPRGVSWVYRDNVVKFTSPADPRIEVLAKEAQAVYERTPIRQFREAKAAADSPLPKLPSDIMQACERFRTSRGNRVVWARRIWKSPLGVETHLDRSRPWSSSARFVTTKPQVAINRNQTLRLLGQPTSKHGFTYIWQCGIDAKGADVVRDIGHYGQSERLKTIVHDGVLKVTFDPDGSGHGVMYYAYPRGGIGRRAP